MAKSTRYYILANYTSKAMVGMIKAPSDRAAAVRKMCKAVGVKFVSLDICRGDFDVVSTVEADSFDKVLGLKMAVLASGAVGEFHILEAMDTAAAFKHARMASEAYTPAG
jgi:uncharacterized protein with GYD domain